MVADFGLEAVVAADIGLEVVVAADTVPEVQVVGTVPEVVEDVVPVIVVAADTVPELVVAADTVLAVPQRLGSDIALAVYNPQQISLAVLDGIATFTKAESSISLAIFPIEEEDLPVGIVVVEKMVSQLRSGCKVVEEEVVENKTWREASAKRRIEFLLIRQDFSYELRDLSLSASPKLS